MDRNLALEFVRVTEAAAVASARLMGRGDERAADEAAVQAMRRLLNSIQMSGEVVFGEGGREISPSIPSKGRRSPPWEVRTP
jgi:fructose-1,6-bisphosphatase/sedoheptulose 1,7-bisphosphatase-like protein